MPTDFATALRDQLADHPRRGLWARRLQQLLDAKPSTRRDRILARLERHARAELVERGMVSAVGAIDWGSVDWSAVLDVILKIIMLLLPLFLGKPPAK